MIFVVVDDHPMIREGLVGALRQFDPGAVVKQASDGEGAIALVQAQPGIDCVLMDLNMPGLPGICAVERLRALSPDLPILVFSSSDEQAHVRSAFAAGASGYCPKSCGNDTLLAALRMVMDGHQYVPPLMLLGQVQDADALASPATVALTGRQAEVLELIAKGLPNKLIARQLDMQEKTVKGHIGAIFRALGAVNRVQAVESARRSGLLAP
jgi:two-component system nitrate/nitrite response regulator NarL